jgi:hypothetical protein
MPNIQRIKWQSQQAVKNPSKDEFDDCEIEICRLYANSHVQLDNRHQFAWAHPIRCINRDTWEAVSQNQICQLQHTTPPPKKGNYLTDLIVQQPLSGLIAGRRAASQTHNPVNGLDEKDTTALPAGDTFIADHPERERRVTIEASEKQGR